MTSVDEPLFAKYTVHRNDGRDREGGDRAGARYFVLDIVHDPYARKALYEYVSAILDKANPPEAHRDRHPLVPHLAGDLLQLLMDTEDAHKQHLRRKEE